MSEAYLKIYSHDEGNSEFIPHSKNGLFTAPIKTSLNGSQGESEEKKLYIRNSDSNTYFTAVDITGAPAARVRVGDPAYPEANIGVKLLLKDTEPSENEWLAVEAGNTITIDEVGDINTADTSYIPFWVKIELPPGTPVQNIADVKLHAEFLSSPLGV